MRLRAAREFRRLRAARLVPPAGGVTFSGGEKVTKKPLETKVSRLPLVARFHEAKGGVRRSARCLSLVALTFLVCPHPAGPAAHKEGL